MLNHIRIVLIQTSHPGNIGAAARAMKTMGLTQLYLVSPLYFPHDKAKEMASGATDILDHAVCVATLDEAIADCQLVLGTSARMRTLPWPLLTPRTMAEEVKIVSQQGSVAILFGREQTGLTNEELHRCHAHVEIPANPDYSSLNIAAAVQVIAYELRLASLDHQFTIKKNDEDLVSAKEMENFFSHLQTTLIDIDFLKKKAPRQLMSRLRRLFFRAKPNATEINILRGILSAIQKGKST